jgi:hypothetical protein
VSKAPIVGVAVIHKDVVYKLPRPKRHHDVVYLINLETGDTVKSSSEQGFYDAEGVFLNRYEAKVRAVETNQLLPGHSDSPKLYSEDVWDDE